MRKIAAVAKAIFIIVESPMFASERSWAEA